MANRNRKPFAVATCRPNEQPIIRESAKSNYARVREILSELGMDFKQYQRDTKLRMLYRTSIFNQQISI